MTKAKFLGGELADTSGYRDVTFTFDFTSGTDSTGAPIWKYPRGLFFGWGTGTQAATSCGLHCAALLDSLKSNNLISDSTIDLPTTVEEGDVFYSFHSTREVPVTFLRGRIGPHLLWALRHDSLDGVLSAAVDSVYADTLLRRSLLRLGVHDETHFDTYRSFQSITSKAQRWMGSRGPGGPLGLWSNPHSQAQTLRIVSGDLDSTAVKMIQLMAVQPYTLVQSILPVTYANPDSMHGSAALFDLYRAQTSGTDKRMIAYNGASDHLAYDTTIYRFLRGKLGSWKDAIDLARSRFPHIPTARPYPVWPVVEAHGFNNSGSYGRIPTPQEITAQAWGALHLHPDGLMFSDFEWDNANLGIVHIITGGHDSEYAVMCDPKPSNSTSCYPLMWVGMRSRFAAVKGFMDELQLIRDTYTKLSYFPLFGVVAEDTGRALAAVLDTIYTRRALPRDTTLAGEPVDGAVEARDSTWLAVSVFEPGAQLAAESVLGVRYLMVTNLRCWPVDRRVYGDSARHYGATYGHADTGLGAVDARLPVVGFRNIWSAMADSIRIERVGHESAWSRVVAAGDTVRLEWLDPGLGALYRVVPVSRGMSALGSAYNNGVRAENPSTDEIERDRIVVYERDSAIYIRTVDSAGTWSPEYMISDPADTISSDGARSASNYLPVFATERNGSSAMAVWERQKGTQHAVWGAFFVDLPDRTRRLDSNSILMQISRVRTLDGPAAGLRLTPAVVGVQGGFVAAWSSMDGIEIRALADSVIDPDTTETLIRAKATFVDSLGAPNDSVCRYPTLAYVSNRAHYSCDNCLQSIAVSAGSSGPITMAVPENVAGDFQIVHLAYQQGKPGDDWRQHIYYNQLGVRFAPDSFPPKMLIVFPTEHVSNRIPGCTFVHPSIAVDSARIGVAFESRNPTAGTIALRFRDVLPPPLYPGKRWWQPSYRWGRAGAAGKWYRFRFASYERPSLTQLPSMDSSDLTLQPEGGLVWQWTNPPTGQQNVVRFYRYGNIVDDEISLGAHPTMMLAPYRAAGNPLSASGIFERGQSASSFSRARPAGGTGTYYPAVLVNNPLAPHPTFTGSNGGRGIIASLTMKNVRGYLPDDCDSINAVLDHGIVFVNPNLPGGITSSDPPPPSTAPPLPPAFFPSVVSTAHTIDSIAKAPGVVRTGVFQAGAAAVEIERVALASTDVSVWLDQQPFDSAHGRPADVAMYMELVRDADGVVLWRGDSLSARALTGTVDEEKVSVPAHLVAAYGTPVYLRLVAVPSAGMDYELGTGFHFVEDTTEGSFARRARPSQPAIPREPRTSGPALGLRVVPNPVRSSAELRLRATATGTAVVTLHSLSGEVVRSYPPRAIERAGDQAIDLDLDGLGNGVYTVRVELDGVVAAIVVTLVR